MNPTGETDSWLVQIENVRLLRDTDTQIPMVRVFVNTFDSKRAETTVRSVSFHMAKGQLTRPGRPSAEEREVIGQLCERFGVESVFDLKGRWATLICPADEGKIIGLKPTRGDGAPVMVMSRKEALRATRLAAN